MNISPKDGILIKNLYLWKGMVNEGCWVNCATRVGNLEASTVCWRGAARPEQYCPATRQWRTAFGA